MSQETGENKFKYDKTIEGWELQEDAGSNLTPASIAQLELVPFLIKQGEKYINGEAVVSRAKTELNISY